MNEQILGREQRIVYTGKKKREAINCMHVLFRYLQIKIKMYFSDILSHIECNIIWRQLQPFVGELTVADIEVCII